MLETGQFSFGRVGVAFILYGLFMAFVAGPELGRRTIEAQNWTSICEQTLVKNAVSKEPPTAKLPQLDMCMLIFGHLGRDGQEYCEVHKGFWNGPLDQVVNAVDAKNRALQNWRMDQATTNSVDQCACASSLTLERRRLDFALFTASARIITSPSIQNLHSELKASLSAPHCALKG